ncbi:MAG: protein-disulfide reductase DsbD domain-containing protein [Hyphomicrobium sp.]
MSVQIPRLPVLAACAALLFPPVAGAEGITSPWVEGFNNKARLIAGRAGTTGKDAVYSGIEISMPAGWKTYWRAPGDAGGIPPEFDFASSENLAEARVLYPAPHRLLDKSGTTVGYKDHVLFPVALTAKDPVLPIVLKLKAAYGVCKELCVPAEAEIELTVPPDVASSAEIAAVLATVPRLTPIQTTDPVVSGWRLDARSDKPVLVIEVADPGGDISDAFVDAKDGIYLPLPKSISQNKGRAVFEIDLTDGVDIKDLQGKPITVTLVGSKGQSETSITLP